MYRHYLAGHRQFPRTGHAAFDLSESAVKKIIRAFNLYGIDGLVAGKRTGRKPRSRIRKRKKFSKNLRIQAVRREPSGPRLPSMAILPRSIRWSARTTRSFGSFMKRGTS